MIIYCTRFTYVDNCLKNTYYSCIQKHRHVGNILLLNFTVRGFCLRNTYSPLISSLTCLQIIEFYVSIQDKAEVLQSSHSRLNSGENISKQVEIICLSWIFNFIALFFFSQTLFYISVWQLMIKTSVNSYAIF